MAAVALTARGQSCIVPRKSGLNEGTPGFEIIGFELVVTFFSCAVPWQLSLATTAGALCSAPITLPVQPNRHPPAIQIETPIENSSRTTFIEKTRPIVTEVYSTSAEGTNKIPTHL